MLRRVLLLLALVAGDTAPMPRLLGPAQTPALVRCASCISTPGRCGLQPIHIPARTVSEQQNHQVACGEEKEIVFVLLNRSMEAAEEASQLRCRAFVTRVHQSTHSQHHET